MFLEGFSRTADLIDSSVKPPYEVKKVTLEDRARALVEPLEIKVNFEADADEPFDQVTAQPEDKIFTHLASLATQRNVLMSSTIRGDLVFYQAEVGKPVGVITEELPPHQSIEATFDGRKRYSSYRVIGPTPKRKAGNALEAFSADANVPRSRFMTTRANDATAGNIQSIADWKRSKQAADAMTIPFPVNSWYAPDGSLWRENTMVTVKSKTIFVPDGFDFLIKSVEYIYESAGTTAVLNLVPPQVYTGEPLEEPWAQ
jgi:prophage tail gpP-like protein